VKNGNTSFIRPPGRSIHRIEEEPLVTNHVARAQQSGDEPDQLRVFAHEVANRLDGALRCVSLLRRRNADDETIRRAEQALVALAALTRSALREHRDNLLFGGSENRTLREAIELATETVAPICQERGIIVEVASEGVGDELLAMGLESVLLNGLWNAIEAVNRDRRITVDVHVKGELLILSVVDNGSGVPPEVIDRAFEIDASSSRGTGIGLNHARAIVTSLGGTIELSNNEDACGATLRVRVPIRSLTEMADG
jgi:signal transduction histidine kinase